MLRYSSGLAIAMAFAAPAWAAVPDAAADAVDAGGPAITVTATRMAQAVEDVPVTVTVIDEERIADELASDIKEMVRFEPGVSVRQGPARFGAAQGVTGRDGNSGFNIRGLEGNRVLVLVDGVRVPDGFTFGAQAAGRGDYVDLGLVKSVEILRGPTSALYGSDGVAGAVSFITADPKDFLKDGKNYGGRLRAQWDSADNEFTESSIIAGRTGRWSALLAYTRRDGKELDNKGTNDVADSRRTTPNPQDTGSDALLGKIVFQASENSRIRLTGEYNKNRVSTDVLSGIAPRLTPAPLPATAVVGLKAHDVIKRKMAMLDWRYDGAGLVEHAAAAVYWQDADNRQFSAEDRNTAADRTRLNTFENRVIGASADVGLRFDTGALSHRLVLGGDISQTQQKGLRDGTVPPAGERFPLRAFPKTDFVLAGAFISDAIEIGDGMLTIFPALRFDYYDLDPENDPLLPAFKGAKQDGSRVSPKIGAVFRAGGGVSLFANYAHGFKAPAPGQVNQAFENVVQNYTSIPNPDLRPETSKTIEGGVRFAGDGVSAEITAFSGRYRNFIEQIQVRGSFRPTDPGVFQFVNLTRAKIEGIEGRLSAKTDWGLTGQLALSYTKGDVIDRTGARTPLMSVDPLKLVAGIGWRDPGDRFGGQIIATHSARKEAGRAGKCADNFGASVACFRPDSFTILDATAFVRMGDIFTLRAGVFNILDKKYAWWSDVRGLPSTSTVTDAYTSPGRNVSLSLSARF